MIMDLSDAYQPAAELVTVKLISPSLCPAGMIVQTMVFFLSLLVAVFLIIIPVLHRQNLVLYKTLFSMW